MNGSVTYEGAILSGNININAGSDPVIEELTATENGTYNTPEGVDGYDPVVVNVPAQEPAILPLNIVENGTYTAPEGLDGYNPIGVNVPIPDDETLNVYANGTYHPSSPDRRFNEVIVDVPTPTPTLTSINITDNGTYTPPTGVDGYNEVNVNITKATINANRLQTNNSVGATLNNIDLDVQLTDNTWYSILGYRTESTDNIANIVGSFKTNFTNYPNGQTVYIGSYELFVTRTYIKMVSNTGSEYFITMYEIPDTRR
jgi:hypothetical protein